MVGGSFSLSPLLNVLREFDGFGVGFTQRRSRLFTHAIHESREKFGFLPRVLQRFSARSPL